MILGSANLTATGVDTLIYQVSNGKNATLTIRITNTTSSTVLVRLQVSATTPGPTSTYILYDYPILPNDIYTETAVVLASQNYVFARTDTPGVNVNAWGFEQ